AAPRNAFMPLSVLQAALDQPGRVNALLARGEPATLQEGLRRHLTLDDWGLVLRDPDSRARSLFDKLDPRGRNAMPVFAASTVGLLGSPPGRGPLLGASLLFPGSTDRQLRRGRWERRVPQAIAALADPKGILSLERVAAFYR